MTHRYSVDTDGPDLLYIQIDGYDLWTMHQVGICDDEWDLDRQHLIATQRQRIYDRFAWVLSLTDDEYLAAGGTYLPE